MKHQRRANRPQSDRGGAAGNARLRRIVTGSEVILTTESIKDLQDSVPRFSPLPQSHLYSSDQSTTELDIASGMPFLHAGFAQQVSQAETNLGNLWLLSGFDPFAVLPIIDGGPIPKKTLMCYFLQRLAPWLSNYDDTLTPTSPRVSWLPFALHHKVLFMATLLSAVVHLDRFQPLGDQRKLLWYKIETMRLANETLNDPTEGASDQMILVALILLYFNVR